MKVVSAEKRYAPVGHCIYCGNTEPPLSDEHIIPYGLGGNFILADASCKACARQTGRVEQVCLREMIRSFRLRKGIPHKRRHSHQQAESLPLHTINLGGLFRKFSVPVRYRPTALVLPHYASPGIFTDRPDSAGCPVTIRTIYDEAEVHRVQLLLGAKGIQLGKLHFGIFAQMLAKRRRSASRTLRRTNPADSLASSARKLSFTGNVRFTSLEARPRSLQLQIPTAFTRFRKVHWKSWDACL